MDNTPKRLSMVRQGDDLSRMYVEVTPSQKVVDRVGWPPQPENYNGANQLA
jgi:hypothetical protein